MLHFHIITLFPESIEPYLKSSIIGRAQKNKKIKVSFYNLKNFIYPEQSRVARDPSTKLRASKYDRVDWRPYGGGPGMVLRPEPILKAVKKAIGNKKGVEKIFFATDGAVFDEV